MPPSPPAEAPSPPAELPSSPAESAAFQRRLDRIRAQVALQVPFFGSLLFKARLVEATVASGIRTAAVTRDGTILVWRPFGSSQSDSELAGLLVHEILHVALSWWERRQDRNPHLWNIAHDYAINLLITEMGAGRGIQLPKGGLLDRQYRDLSAEEIYDRLPKLPAAQAWGVGDVTAAPSPLSPGEEEKYRQVWEEILRDAAHEHTRAMGADSLPRPLQKFLWEIRVPRVTWRDVFSRWIGTHARVADFSYRRPSRRSESIGEILASTMPIGLDNVVVLWDASGSMEGRETLIMSEVIAICGELRTPIRCIGCDTEILWDVADVQSPGDIPFTGGGGSDFRPAFQRLDQEGHTGVVVAFTDGYILVPDTPPPSIRAVLWVQWSTDGDPPSITWGEVIRVDPNGFVGDPNLHLAPSHPS